MASVPSRAASAQRNFFAGSLARPAKGASKGRTSGRLFSAASRVHLSRPTRLGSPGCGLSSAPTRDKCTRDGAELATSKALTAAAPDSLSGPSSSFAKRAVQRHKFTQQPHCVTPAVTIIARISTFSAAASSAASDCTSTCPLQHRARLQQQQPCSGRSSSPCSM